MFKDSLMGSGSEDEDDDDAHIRGPSLGLGQLGPNGPDSAGPLGPSDLSVQSISTDSKNTHDDSDQVIKQLHFQNYSSYIKITAFCAPGFTGWRSGRKR